MGTEYPKVVRREQKKVSPWLNLVEKEVLFSEGAKSQVYHSVNQAAYIAMMAVMQDGRIPIVRQYRPCVESFTWEFPGGTLDEGETPKEAAIRELREETGLETLAIHDLGCFYPDTGRLGLDSHAFFIEASNPKENFVEEEGVNVRFVTPSELRQMMHDMEFCHLPHWGIYAAAILKGWGCKFGQG